MDEKDKKLTEIDVNEPWFTYLQKGIKTVEGRKATEKWKNLSVGDRLLFRDSKNPNRTFKAKITRINRYGGRNPLRYYLKGETLKRTLPSIKTYVEGEKVYLQFWNEKEIKDTGMLAIQVEVI